MTNNRVIFFNSYDQLSILPCNAPRLETSGHLHIIRLFEGPEVGVVNKRHGTDVKELGASINNNTVCVHENPFEAHRKTVETKSRNSLLKLSSVSVNYYQ